MYIVNTFEKQFGSDISTGLSDKVVAKMAGSVVAIASFNGDFNVIC
jgi:hypothetical protein